MSAGPIDLSPVGLLRRYRSGDDRSRCRRNRCPSYVDEGPIDIPDYDDCQLPPAPTEGPKPAMMERLAIRCSFRSRFVHDGLLDEDSEIWDSEGTLVAQSRQLALMPRP